MRRFLILAALIVAAPAFAQTPPAAAVPPNATAAPPAVGTAAALPSTPARPARAGHRTQTERFDQANTTHDGKLTLDQAKAAHMNAVARDFAAIDKDGKGFVTMADIRQHRHAVREAKKVAAKR